MMIPFLFSESCYKMSGQWISRTKLSPKKAGVQIIATISAFLVLEWRRTNVSALPILITVTQATTALLRYIVIAALSRNLLSSKGRYANLSHMIPRNEVLDCLLYNLFVDSGSISCCCYKSVQHRQYSNVSSYTDGSTYDLIRISVFPYLHSTINPFPIFLIPKKLTVYQPIQDFWNDKLYRLNWIVQLVKWTLSMLSSKHPGV